MAGYSGTPLAKKLGIQPDSRIAVASAPRGFAIPQLPDTVQFPMRGPYDVVLAFATTRGELTKHLEDFRPALHPSGGLWIAWPKRTSGLATELTEDVVRDEGIAHKLVDNKVCAIDEVWSGLRLVIRRVDRPAPPRR
jgi:hypothetical protein